MKTGALLAFTAATILGSAQTMAWDSFGHMEVAAVAYDQLTPQARTRVKTLLKLNPRYKSWIAGVPASDRDKVAFVTAATWADSIKSAKGYKNDGEKPSGPDSARNIGYTDKLQHRYWHFIDIPFSPDHTPLVNPVAPNAKTQIVVFTTTIGSHTAKAGLRSYDLVWVLHLVGDVHQPLHATSRFTHDQPNGDQGGNLVHLCASPCKDELHAFWDDLMDPAKGKPKGAAAAIQAAKGLAAADPASAAIDDVSTWIDESEKDAEKFVYASPVGVGAGPFTLDAGYEAKAHDVAAQRVALAGARLANLLNKVLQ